MTRPYVKRHDGDISAFLYAPFWPTWIEVAFVELGAAIRRRYSA